jgi:mRNA-degrading endonuclease RelE of RelBE toxin-antitoxin system
MRIIETPVFTRAVIELLPDDDYRSLQTALALRPEAGAVIKGSGGLRKIRWACPGRGKRGGVRVIYYWATAEDIVFMLLIYPKNRQDDLTPQQLRMLRNLVKEEFR